MPNQDNLIESQAPVAKFTVIGDTTKLTITAWRKGVATNISTGEPMLSRTGQPVQEYVITGNADDGEEVRIFEKKQMLSAIQDALRAAGLKTWDETIGGTLAVQFESEKPSTTPGHHAQKIYRAQFVKPAAPAPGLAASLI